MFNYINIGFDIRRRNVAIKDAPQESKLRYFQASKDIEIWPRPGNLPDIENEFGMYFKDTAKQLQRKGVLIGAKIKLEDINFLSTREINVFNKENDISMDEGWFPMGFDVVDNNYYYSAMFNFGIDLEAYLANKCENLNKYGLFEDYHSSSRFASFASNSDKTVNHGPFVPVWLWFLLRGHQL